MGLTATEETKRQPGLRFLLGENTELFLVSSWQKAPWHGRCSDALALITEKDVQAYISNGLVPPSGIRVFQSKVALDQTEYCSLITSQSTIRPSRVNALFREGAPLVLEAMHLRFPELARFCERLGADLGHVVGVNGYYTPPKAQGFSRHHDSHDVFILQVAGSKRWSLYRPQIELPVSGQRYDQNQEGAGGEPASEVLLEAGDVLYLPRGWVHEAHTIDEVSLHLTFGVQIYTWLDDLIKLVRSLAFDELLLREEAGSCSPNHILELIAPHLQAADIARRADERLREAATPAASWQSQSDIDALSTRTLVRKTPGLHVTLEAGEKDCLIQTSEVRISLAVEHFESVRWLLDSSSDVLVGNIPGPISDAARVALARTFIAEGVLSVSLDGPVLTTPSGAPGL